MLGLIGTPAGITYQPRLEATIESTSRSRITTTIRHDTTHHDSLDLILVKHLLQIGIDEGVVRVLRHDLGTIGILLQLILKLPVIGAGCDGARRTPLAN